VGLQWKATENAGTSDRELAGVIRELEWLCCSSASIDRRRSGEWGAEVLEVGQQSALQPEEHVGPETTAGARLADFTRVNYVSAMAAERITRDPKVMGGKPCIRGMRITTGAISGLVASGHSGDEVLRMYPFLEEEDIRAALAEADADIAARRLLSPEEVRRSLNFGGSGANENKA
jgi:uncharacterized protein (DUF433 family)